MDESSCLCAPSSSGQYYRGDEEAIEYSSHSTSDSVGESTSYPNQRTKRRSPHRLRSTNTNRLSGSSSCTNRSSRLPTLYMPTCSVILLWMIGWSLVASLLGDTWAQTPPGLTTEQVFTTRPKSDQYFVNAGTSDLLLPCSFNTSLLSQQGWVRQWVKNIVDQGPVVLTDNDRNREQANYELISNSISGVYNLKVLGVTYERDDARFFCQLVSPTNQIYQVQATVVVLVRPTDITIGNMPEDPVSESRVLYPKCISRGGNPEPTLTWKFDDGSPIPTNWTTVRREKVKGEIGYTVESELRLTVTADYNNRYFTCDAFNEAMRTENQPLMAQTGKMMVLYKPRVKVGPVQSYNVELGDPAELTCTADGNPENFQFLWRQTSLGSTLPQANRARISFTTTKQSQGNYTCDVTNSEGTGSASLSLFVSYRPIIHLSPESQNVEEEKSLSMTCTVDAFPPATLIEWVGPTGQKFNGSTWVIDNVTRVHKGNYTCSAENTISVYGKQPQVRRSSGSTQVFVTYPPGQAKLIIQPSTVTVGDNVTLVCMCDDPGYPAASFTFKFNGRELPTNGESTLQIPSVSVSDAGDYECVPSNPIDFGPPGKHSLRVYQPATLVKYLEAITGPYKEGNLGVMLSCRANGNPKPMFTWYKDGRRLPDQGGRYTIEAREGDKCTDTLRCLYEVTSSIRWTNGVTWEDHGTYRCVTSNSVGDNASSGMLKITHSPHVINTDGQSRYAADLGSQGELRCIVTSLPKSSFRWYRANNEEIKSGPAGGNRYEISEQHNVEDDITTGTLTIASVQQADYADYYCEPYNNEGVGDRHKISLQLKSRPLPPTNLEILSMTSSSLLVAWQPGFDGGHQQNFILKAIPHDAVTGNALREQAVEYPIPGEFDGSFQGIGRRAPRYLGRSYDNRKEYNATGLNSATAYSVEMLAKNAVGDSTWTPQLQTLTSRIPASSDITPPTEAKYTADSQMITYRATADNLPLCVMVYIQRDDQLYRYDCMSASSTSESVSTITNIPSVKLVSIAFCKYTNRPTECSEVVEAKSVAPASSALLDVLVPIVIVAAALLALAAVVMICCCMNRCSKGEKRRAATHDQFNGGRAKTISNPYPTGTMEPENKQTVEQRSDSGMYTMQSAHPNFDPAAQAYTNNAMRNSFDEQSAGTMDRWSPSTEQYNQQGGQGYDMADMEFSGDGLMYYGEDGQPIDMTANAGGQVQMHDDDGSYSYSAAGGRRVMQEIVV